LENLGKDWMIILTWILGKQRLRVSTGSGWGLVAGSCEHGNGHSGSVKGRGFLQTASESEERIQLHQVGDWLWALVNMVMELLVQ
jgi:hypothetical protein